ncbi:MAG TPA: hydrogenase maturation protease [Kofleriaceae bacterium]|nr:hydrogenase maturation protease [Kofleriaceae bacterium]
MTRVLVAGIGNIFFGDDGFGVEVARRLADAPPAGARVADFGIRALHLAYDLLAPIELCIVADCMPRGDRPGTLYVLEPDVEAEPAEVGAGHGLSLPAVFSAVRQLGGRPPRTLVVGCEPEDTGPGIGLSDRVSAAVPHAIDLIHRLVHSSEASP